MLCAQQVSPQKMLRIAFGIRALSSSYIHRVFLKTEMTLKSRSMINDSSRNLQRSKSSENLPSSQSQVNIQMMSRTLTIREVRCSWITLFRVGEGLYSTGVVLLLY